MAVMSDRPEGFVGLSRGVARQEDGSDTRNNAWRAHLTSPQFWAPNFHTLLFEVFLIALTVGGIALWNLWLGPMVHQTQTDLEQMKSQVSEITNGITGGLTGGDSTNGTYDPPNM